MDLHNGEGRTTGRGNVGSGTSQLNDRDVCEGVHTPVGEDIKENENGE